MLKEAVVTRLLALCILLSLTLPSASSAEVRREAFQIAHINGRVANEGFRRCRLYVDGWLAHADKKTGLIPRNLGQSRDIWNAQDSAADNYPFMVLTAAITDRALFEGRMLSILDDMWAHAPVETPYGRIVSQNVEINGEMLQTLSRVYWMTGCAKYLEWAMRLGDYYLLGDRHPTGRASGEGPQGQWLLLDCGEAVRVNEVGIAWICGDRRIYRFKIEVSADGSEFTEVFAGASGGRTNDLEAYAFAPAAARLVRVTGFGSNENDFTNIAELTVHEADGTQAAVKVAGASGHQNPNVPANAVDGDMTTRWSVPGGTGGPERLRLRDHGCEIVSGLCELYAAVHFARPEKKPVYREPIHRMLDRILDVGRNEHGLFYNWVDPATGAHDANLCDTWGYTLNGFYTVYMIDGTQAYRQAVLKALGSLYEHYRNYPWEGSSADGHTDSIESALNLYSREPVASAAEWIDDDIKVMWAIQKDDGVIEGWHGDGNFARTTIMYCLWKTQGVTVRPWRKDVVFGAQPLGDELCLVMSADEPWQGVLLFDSPRHRTIMKLPIDWPRINQFPEWFTAECEKSYIVEDGDTRSRRTYSGRQMQQGVEVSLHAGKPLRLIVREIQD